MDEALNTTTDDNDVLSIEDAEEAFEITNGGTSPSQIEPSLDKLESSTRNKDSASADESQAPLFRLVFKDAATFNELRGVVSTCIRDTLFARKHSIEVQVKADEFAVCFNELQSSEGQNDSIFMIDTLPTEKEDRQKHIPAYASTRNSTLLNNESPVVEANEDTEKPKNNCWNCGGDHMLRECPKPRDNNQINRSKNAFNRNRTERYHVDGEKYGNVEPGKISDGLRDALGLSRRELPSYIYRMRLYGYPVSNRGFELLQKSPRLNFTTISF